MVVPYLYDQYRPLPARDPQMSGSINVDIGGSQIIGKREYQEDTLYFDVRVDSRGQEIVLAVLADGVGGHGGGDIASQLAVRAFAAYVWTAIGDAASALHPAPICMPAVLHAELEPFATQLENDLTQALARDDSPRGLDCLDNPAVVLLGALCFANDSLTAVKTQMAGQAAMGCTLVATLVHQAKLWWISVGDSHVYLVRDRGLYKKNAIHDYGSLLDAKRGAGEPVTEEEMRLSRKTLVSTVSGDELTLIDCSDEPMELRVDDCAILSSDGLNGLSAARIVFNLAENHTAQDSATVLLLAVDAMAHPWQDNTAVVVMRCLATVR